MSISTNTKLGTKDFQELQVNVQEIVSHEKHLQYSERHFNLTHDHTTYLPAQGV